MRCAALRCSFGFRRFLCGIVFALPCGATVRAADLAEVEVTEFSRESPGAAATHGYFVSESPALVSATEAETPVGDGSGDVLVTFTYLYRDPERVNPLRSGGVVVLPPPDPGHSFAQASGYADAGADELGGYTNLGASAFVLAGEHASTAAAVTDARIQVSLSIEAGVSGAAPGDPVSGLRWEFDTHGNLGVNGRAYPATTFSAASMDFHGILLRGPSGRCGVFACPRGALAAAVTLKTGLSAQSTPPGTPGDPTGRIDRNRSWSASDNRGAFQAGGVFKSGSDQDVLALPVTENDSLLHGTRVDTAGSPLGLDAIDFDATVGETLSLTVQLTASSSLDGMGDADADLFGSFGMRVFDPLDRGYELVFSVAPVPEPGAQAWILGGLLGAAGLGYRRRARPRAYRRTSAPS